MNVTGAGGLQERVSFFNIFTRIFPYFLYFMIFSYVEQIRKICLLGRKKVANAKTTKTMLAELIT